MDNKKKQPSNPMRNPFFSFLLLSIIATIALNAVLSRLGASQEKEIYYSDFVQMLDRDEIEEVTLSSDKIVIYPKKKDKKDDQKLSLFPYSQETGTVYYTGWVNDDALLEKLEEHHVKYTRPVVKNSYLMDILLTWILPFALMYLVLGLFIRFMSKKMGGSGGFMSVGQSNAKIYMENKTGVTFADVAGQEEAKESLNEIVDFLHNPGKYTAIGAKQPKGALLVGPPGTGKTLLAKAVAGEANVPFFSISGSDFVEMFVGVGASRVRDLFEQAKKNAPSIIFIDEIDAVGRHRGTGIGGGHDEREQTLNQLLVEMDGFTGKDNVIVIAATNRRDILDPALMRPGRFDRQIVVGYPDVKGREAILKVHTKSKNVGPDVDLGTIAKSTVGFTGADLENLVNEACLLAARKDKKAITMEEIQEATIKVIAGPEKKSHKVTPKEKRLTAFHEAGHAVCTYYCDHQDKVHQVSIIPRGMAGGYTMSLPEQDKSFVSKKEMEENIVTLLGGRVAEQLVLEDISTGASNDLERATSTARSMVTRYGFSEKLGPVVYGNDQNEVFLGRDLGSSKDYSDRVAGEIDDEVRSIIEKAYQQATAILNAHMDQLHLLAKYLIIHEKIERDDFETLMQGKMDPKLLEETTATEETDAPAPTAEPETEAELSTDTPAE